jgi:hypothetical protein
MSRDFSTTLADEFWTGMTTTLNAATQGSTPAGTCVDASTVINTIAMVLPIEIVRQMGLYFSMDRFGKTMVEEQ